MSTRSREPLACGLLVAGLMFGCGKSAPSESELFPAAKTDGGGRAVSSAAPASAPPPSVLLPTPDCQQPAPSAKCSAGFCRIEPGCFIIGAPRSEFGVGRYTDRQVQVRLTRAFSLGQTEVTRSQWQAARLPLPKARPPATESEPASQAKATTAASCGEPDCPVANLSWFDALAFANRYSEREGLEPCYTLSECAGEIGAGLSCKSVKVNGSSLYACTGYRLPSEAEWEYAARAGTVSAFFSGDVSRQVDGGCHPDESLERIGWYCQNSGDVAHRVAQKAANAWGLHDTSGNLSEWCNDQKSFQGFGEGPFVDPVWPARTGTDLSATGDGQYRIARGGSYLSPACDSKANWRAAFPDATTGPNLGFRLARSVGTATVDSAKRR